MIARSMWTLGAGLLLALTASACDRGPTDADPATMRRWAEELSQDAAQLREQIRTVRRLAPEQWHDRMGEHAGVVIQTLDRMDRRMDEMRQMGGMGMRGMGMGMGMRDAGTMMGMSMEGHQEMIGLMETLRSDVRQLGVAPPAEVMERMPEHLQRLETMAEMMEQSAAHMRSMEGMGAIR